MARYRIVSRPLQLDLKHNVYDVQERLSMEFPDGSTANYWSFVEDFGSIEEAKEYVEALAKDCLVVAEYD